MLDVRLLGPVQAYVAGVPIDLGPRKQRLVLAVLALEVNQLVPVDRLVELMWLQAPPRTAVHAVRVCASGLRPVLARTGAELLGRGNGYVLRADPMAIDVHRFRALAAEARTVATDAERVDLLDRALALWTGPALSGSAPHEVSERLCRGLEEARLLAIEDRVEARLRLGHHREVLDELAGLAEAHPIRERLVGAFMLALYRAGRAGDALQAYRQVQRWLADELGLDPGADLQKLELAILRGEPSLDPDVVPETRARARVPALLPPAVAGFTGRDVELARLDGILAEHGDHGPAVLISAIAGTAGVGKTSLAVHWAHRVADRFPDGQLYVNLRGFDAGGPALSPAEVMRRFLDALGVPSHEVPAGQQAQTDLYRSLLAGRRVLVLLDNAATVEQVRPLLPGAPGCVVLVTSRNQLTSLVAVEGAHPIALDLLTVAEARQMLARRLGPDRVAGEPEAVEQILVACARLPLALAIVAARAAVQPGLTLSTVADSLAGARLDPFDGGDTATDVRAVFSWSYRSLSDGAARLFRLLGLHPGPDISDAAAASLAGTQVHRHLTELTGAHLLAEHQSGRYAFHDLLRAYAGELGASAELADTDAADERDTARRRLLDHYLHTAHRATLLLDPHRDPIALAPAEAGVVPEELADLDGGVAWFTAEQPVLLAAVTRSPGSAYDRYTWQLAWTLTTFLHRRGHPQDKITMLDAALVAARRLGDRAAQAFLLRSLGLANLRLERFDEANDANRRALRLFAEIGDRDGQAHTHMNLSWAAHRLNRLAEGNDHALRALELYRAAGNQIGEARALGDIGWTHTQLGEYQEARACCEKALAVHQETGDREGEATAWDSLGYIHHQLAAFREAVDCYRRAVEMRRDLGDRSSEAETLSMLGDTQRAAGETDAAREAWQQALMIFEELGHADAGAVRAKLG